MYILGILGNHSIKFGYSLYELGINILGGFDIVLDKVTFQSEQNGKNEVPQPAPKGYQWSD